MADGVEHEVRLGFEAELFHEAGPVGLDGAAADGELFGDPGIAQALGGKFHHEMFAVGELGLGAGAIKTLEAGVDHPLPESLADILLPIRGAVNGADELLGGGILDHVTEDTVVDCFKDVRLI